MTKTLALKPCPWCGPKGQLRLRTEEYCKIRCDICTECTKLLKAIEASEIEEGCNPDESQPGFGELYDAMSEDDAGRYRAKAAAMFPEIADHVAKYYPERNEDD